MLLCGKISTVILFILFQINFHACNGAPNGATIKVFNGTRASNDPAIQHVVSLRNLRHKQPYGEDHICGGTILKSNLILTAAHCVSESDDNTIFDPKYFYVVAGSPYLFSKNNKTQIRRVRNIYVHKGYKMIKPIHDIAILELDENLQEDGKTVQRINIISKQLREHELCTIYGWGVVDCYQNYKGSVLANVIQSTKMINVGDRRCMDIGLDFEKPGIFCAVDNSNQSQSCRGDSGSPLICRGQVAGLDSHGDARPQNAEYFTNIWRYNAWIKHYNRPSLSKTYRSGAGTHLLCFTIFVNVFVVISSFFA